MDEYWRYFINCARNRSKLNVTSGMIFAVNSSDIPKLVMLQIKVSVVLGVRNVEIWIWTMLSFINTIMLCGLLWCEVQWVCIKVAKENQKFKDCTFKISSFVYLYPTVLIIELTMYALTVDYAQRLGIDLAYICLCFESIKKF